MTSIFTTKPIGNLARIAAVLAAGSMTACSSGFFHDDSPSNGVATDPKSASAAPGSTGADGSLLQRPSDTEAAMGDAPGTGNGGTTGIAGEPQTSAPQASAPQASAPQVPPAAAPGASPPPAANPSGRVNSPDVIVSDMRELNDGPLLKVNPSYGFSRGPGYVIQGNDPRGVNTPAWFQNNYPYLINGNYWNYIMPWMVVFEGVGNGSSNARVHFRNMKLYVKSKGTGAWSLSSQAQTMGGSYCAQDSNYFACANADGAREESDGGISFDTKPGMNYHGYFGGFAQVNGPDIAAVFVTMHARLVRDSNSGPNDLSAAKFLLHVGADYYREAAPASTVGPGVGNSRAKYLKENWQAFNMLTFSDVGIQEPGGGISEAQLRANPPPME